MSRQVWKGSTLLNPEPPVLVSCGSPEKPNLITVGWTGTICTQPPMLSISVRPERYSHHLIKESGEFVINMMPSTLVRSLDYCGIKSGKNEDKLAKMKLYPQESNTVSAPQIAQAPISIECKVTEVLPQGSHDMFIAEITSVNIDKNLIDEKGKLHMEKAGLMTYAHGTYYALGKKIGSFGFSVKPKRTKNSGKKPNKGKSKKK